MEARQKKKKILAAFTLLAVACIWGMAFVAQSAGVRYIGPFTLIGARSLLAAFGLIAAVFCIEKASAKPRAFDRKETIKAGVLLGVVFFFASNLQQLGLLHTTAGKAGFITSLYIVLVPVGSLFGGKRAHFVTWLCAAAALAGLCLLSINDTLSVNKGDLLELGCAAFFTLHILLIDRFARRVDVMRMSAIQFIVTGVLSLILALIVEKPSMRAVLNVWPMLVYVGLLSGSFCYTAQMFAQRTLEPTVASLLLSLESVFAAIGGALFLGETMTARECLGCGIVFSAVLCSQLPWGALRKTDARHIENRPERKPDEE